LKREVSGTEQDAAEQIATLTKAAFERGELLSITKSSATSVQFWMESMSDHIDALQKKDPSDSFVANLDKYCSLYWRFVSTRLLEVVGPHHI
jgi:hypothetical protein